MALESNCYTGSEVDELLLIGSHGREASSRLDQLSIFACAMRRRARFESGGNETRQPCLPMKQKQRPTGTVLRNIDRGVLHQFLRCMRSRLRHPFLGLTAGSSICRNFVRDVQTGISVASICRRGFDPAHMDVGTHIKMQVC